jgi:hypothetical protein
MLDLVPDHSATLVWSILLDRSGPFNTAQLLQIVYSGNNHNVVKAAGLSNHSDTDEHNYLISPIAVSTNVYTWQIR